MKILAFKSSRTIVQTPKQYWHSHEFIAEKLEEMRPQWKRNLEREDIKVRFVQGELLYLDASTR
jgi:hypothetical protein